MLFHFWNDKIIQFNTGDDRRDLKRLVFILTFFFGILIVALVATPVDPFLVYMDKGYERPSIVYSVGEDGQDVPVAEFYNFSRRVISLDNPEKINSRIVQCFIATEDNNFFSHFGIDVQGILRAAFVNILAGRVKEGASTITQQAARLRFLSRKRSMLRKAREAFLALWMELRYSKSEILELYFNEVPLGHGTLGVEAASQFYFDRHLFDLKWGEAAVIASLTTRPRDFSPLHDINESRMKVRVVFKRLIENGMIDIDEAISSYRDLEENYYAGLNRSPNESAFSQRLNLHPYVTAYVRSVIPAKFKRRLETGGLHIYTTIDEDHQTAAEEVFIPYLLELTAKRKRPPFKNFDKFDEQYGDAVSLIRNLFDIPDFRIKDTRESRRFQREFLTEFRNELKLLNLMSGERQVDSALNYHIQNNDVLVEEELKVEGSLISMRPYTGEITSVIGGSGFDPSNQLLRYASSRRQPGSSFKPILYASGIEYTAREKDKDHYLTAATLVDDSPIQFVGQDLSEYSPENYSGGFMGPIRLRKALTLSKNAVAVRVYERMGSRNITPIIQEILSLKNRSVPREASVALGTFGLTTYEMARAFSVFASEGKETKPYLIRYITDAEGNILADYRTDSSRNRQVISPETASIISDMMKDVVRSGTGKAASLSGRDVAGKTGTTNRNTDAWFVGFTGNLVTSIHIGYDIVRSLGTNSTGGNTAAPVWGKYMYRALKKEKSIKIPMSGNIVAVEICELSGKRPGERCKERIAEKFVPGTEPAEICEDHSANYESTIPLIQKKEDIFNVEDF